MKRILVTGGAGYIGSHTVVELIAAGYEAIIVDNFSNSSVEVLDRLKTITGVEVPFYKGSISDKDFMNRVFEENQIDAVIHFAAYKAVGESVQEPLKYYKNSMWDHLSCYEVAQSGTYYL